MCACSIPIYLQQQIALQVDRDGGGGAWPVGPSSQELCLAWFDRYRKVIAAAQPQHGEANHYRRRRPADYQLDPELSLAEQVNLLRVVENQSYPAFFHWRGRRYVLQVQPEPLRSP